MKDDRLYLHHMLERCRRITRFVRPGRDAFMASDELQDAVIRNVEVIGEAAKRVSPEARGLLASLDWRAICGMRDVLIHNYIGVDLDEVWERGLLPHTGASGGAGAVLGRWRRYRLHAASMTSMCSTGNWIPPPTCRCAESKTWD